MSLGIAVALALAAPAAAAGPKGTLAGEAEISHGCPGPVSENGPLCNPWHPYAGAHIQLSRVGSRWTTSIVSDERGRFALRLPAGSYSVTGVSGVRTKPTGTQQIRIRAGLVTRIVVRFDGFPMME